MYQSTRDPSHVQIVLPNLRQVCDTAGSQKQPYSRKESILLFINVVHFAVNDISKGCGDYHDSEYE